MVPVGIPAGSGKFSPDSPLGLMASAVKIRNDDRPNVATMGSTFGAVASGLTMPTSVSAPIPAETAMPSMKANQ